MKEQSDNDAKVGQLKKDIAELSDGFTPEYHIPSLPSEEVQRLKANFTRERYNQLLSELEQMKKEKKISFTDYSDIRFRLNQINGELKDQGAQKLIEPFTKIKKAINVDYIAFIAF
ncbi:hypothetical protein ACXVUH_01360 (plasmid) [Ligilactobacillus salivarius]